MLFPIAEVKFSRIVRAAGATSLLIRLYRVDDGGVVAGTQQYVRTLQREHAVTLTPGTSRQDLLDAARQKLDDLIAAKGWTLQPEQIVCTLA